jgi:hypothetical protein
VSKSKYIAILQADLTKLVSRQEMLVIGNPTMPKVTVKIGKPPQQLPQLPGAETEARAIASLLQTQPNTAKVLPKN